MAQKLNEFILKLSAYSFVATIFFTRSAFAQETTSAAQANVSTVTGNIVHSISNIPALLSALTYITALTIGTFGVLKVKDHVENPSQTPLKEGAIRLAVGGALLSLPMLFDVLSNSFGSSDLAIAPYELPDLFN